MDPERLAKAYLENHKMNELADYKSRGRCLVNLSDAELAEHWVCAYKAMATKLSRETLREEGDASAELRLRNQQPPMKGSSRR